MKYESTRGSQLKKTGAQAIIQGIAEDKGLYMPESIPALPFKIEEMTGKSYKEIAFRVIGAFFDDFTEEEMKNCIDGAYDSKFTAPDTVELREAGGAHFLELYHGKTAAFKDMALSILPYLMREKKLRSAFLRPPPVIRGRRLLRALQMCRERRLSCSILQAA